MRLLASGHIFNQLLQQHEAAALRRHRIYANRFSCLKQAWMINICTHHLSIPDAGLHVRACRCLHVSDRVSLSPHRTAHARRPLSRGMARNTEGRRSTLGWDRDNRDRRDSAETQVCTHLGQTSSSSSSLAVAEPERGRAAGCTCSLVSPLLWTRLISSRLGGLGRPHRCGQSQKSLIEPCVFVQVGQETRGNDPRPACSTFCSDR